jgi:hypothetical protein
MNDEVQIGLGFATAESIHGSLLIIQELVLHANMVKEKIFYACARCTFGPNVCFR